MSSKYVPPALRNSNTTSTTHATTTARSTSMRDSYVSHSSVPDSIKPSLVNTSLPAKVAPKLVPATLASLTSDVSSMTSSFKGMNLEKVSIYKNHPKNPSLTEDDFPTLGAKPAVKSVAKPAMNFAEKAREWAIKQKEDERIAAEEAEKERARISLERMMKEKEEKEEKLFKKTLITLASIKKSNELDRYDDRNDNLSDYEEEPYESPPEEEEEEEEEQDEHYSYWDGRRYRDEY